MPLPLVARVHGVLHDTPHEMGLLLSVMGGVGGRDGDGEGVGVMPCTRLRPCIWGGLSARGGRGWRGLGGRLTKKDCRRRSCSSRSHISHSGASTTSSSRSDGRRAHHQFISRRRARRSRALEGWAHGWRRDASCSAGGHLPTAMASPSPSSASRRRRGCTACPDARPPLARSQKLAGQAVRARGDRPARKWKLWTGRSMASNLRRTMTKRCVTNNRGPPCERIYFGQWT